MDEEKVDKGEGIGEVGDDNFVDVWSSVDDITLGLFEKIKSERDRKTRRWGMT